MRTYNWADFKGLEGYIGVFGLGIRVSGSS